MASIYWFDAASAVVSRPVYSPRLSSSRIFPEILLAGSPRLHYTRRALTSSPMVVRRCVLASSSLAEGTPSDEMEKRSSGCIALHDLLIVGPGVLGRLVAEEWKKEYPESQIVGQTMTADHHEELVKIGIKPVIRGMELIHKFPYVIFCAPPSRTPDYPGDVRLALSNWSGEGSLLFTSSSAPYDCDNNGTCDEDSAVVPIGRSPKTDVLLKAERIVVEAGGCVLRLAGLYKEDRGAHTYWLKKGTVEASPDHILNLIHYEDAASLSVALLKKNTRSRIFLGCDNNPLSRQEMMNLVDRSGKFSNTFVGFTGTAGPSGKKLNNTKTRKEIEWEPKHHLSKMEMEFHATSQSTQITRRSFSCFDGNIVLFKRRRWWSESYWTADCYHPCSCPLYALYPASPTPTRCVCCLPMQILTSLLFIRHHRPVAVCFCFTDTVFFLCVLIHLLPIAYRRFAFWHIFLVMMLFLFCNYF